MKKYDNDNCSASKLIAKNIQFLKKKSHDDNDYKLKNKEISLLNENINNTNKKIDCLRVKFKNEKQKIDDEFQTYKKESENNCIIENSKLDETIKLIDDKFIEISNYFLNLKKDNLDLKNEIDKFEVKIKNLELEIFKIDLKKIEKQMEILNDKIKTQQKISSNNFLILKNKFDDKIDELKKKNRVEIKLNNLHKQKNDNKDIQQLILKKNYLQFTK